MTRFPGNPAHPHKRKHPCSFAALRLALGASLLALLLAGCNSGNNDSAPPGNTDKDFPVDQIQSAALKAKGLPAAVADFLAAAKLDTVRVDANTFTYKQTFPNGATRDITLKITPGQTYAPTADESTRVAKGGPALYDIKFSHDSIAGGSKADLSYFVPTAGLPPELIAALGSSSLTPEEMRRIALPKAGARSGPAEAADGGTGGAAVNWGEVGKNGADVSIGALLDAAKESGLPTGALSNIYSLASAASAIGGALELSQQNAKWFLELDALKKCAENPTNPVTKSDPNYSSNAAAKVDQARSEIKEVNSVRFLNQMNETAAGITPQTAAMSVGMKAGSAWADASLGDFSENTIMREARLAVVPCGDPPGQLTGNVDVLWSCTETSSSGTVVTKTHTVSTVGWEWDATFRRYFSIGAVEYESVKTSSSNVRTCVYKETYKGDLAKTGSLLIFYDAAYIKQFGYDYLASGDVSAEVDWTESCQGTSGTGPVTIEWLPPVQGLSGGSGIMGKMINPSCVGSSATGTEVTEWSFALPPKEK
ncbi:MAG: hypothetical protein JWO30_4018 [Fibrobacteres bacterium]|nr:hypothetical protein [Fibrobacterota bacterium]